jgi:hypothetical protein
MPQQLYLRGKSIPYISKELSGPQSRYGASGEEIVFLPLPGPEPRNLQPIV